MNWHLFPLLSLAPLTYATEPVWLSDQPVPKAAEIRELSGMQFHVIKANEPEKDGYVWLHGVGPGWHKGKLEDSGAFASQAGRKRKPLPSQDASAIKSGVHDALPVISK